MGRLAIKSDESRAGFQRRVLLQALHELSVPARRDEVQAYVSVFSQGVYDVPEFSGLLAEDLAAWRSGSSRDVWLCPALCGTEALPETSYMAQSNWKVENRIVGNGLSGSRHLWLLRVFCDQYIIAEEEGLDGLAILAGQIRNHADAVSARLSNELVMFLDDSNDLLDISSVEELREAAEDHYSEVIYSERSRRRIIAEHLDRLPESLRLFGSQ